MEVKFCRRCGAPTETRSEGVFVCANGHHLFYKAATSTGVFLLNDKQEVLLTIRGIDPDKGAYDCPGGFCNMAETFLDAAHRELREELGVTPADYTPLQFLLNAIDYYKYEGERTPVQIMMYWARVKGEPAIAANDDVADILWVPLSDVDITKFVPDFTSAPVAIELLRKKATLKRT